MLRAGELYVTVYNRNGSLGENGMQALQGSLLSMSGKLYGNV